MPITIPEPSEEILQKIERIRKLFEKELEKNPNDYHSVDIERVQNEQWQVERYVIDNQYDINDDNSPFNAMCTALKWKKLYKVHDNTEQTFPKEFFELNEIEINGRDKNGHLIQWEATRNQKKIKELDTLTKEFMAFCLERLDRTAGRDGFVYITDNGGAGLSNVDMDLNKFKIAAIENYPLGLRQMYVVDLPWILNSVMSLILKFMSPKLRELVVYVKKNELTNFIDIDNIPTRLSGKREKRAYPQNTKPMDQMMNELGVDEKFIDSFYKSYKLERTK